jgi:hypothetical protein
MADLLAAARRTADGGLLLAEAEAASVLDLEDLLTTRWENAAAIAAYADRFRGPASIPPVVVPAGFTAQLRPCHCLRRRTGPGCLSRHFAWPTRLRLRGGSLADAPVPLTRTHVHTIASGSGSVLAVMGLSVPAVLD